MKWIIDNWSLVVVILSAFVIATVSTRKFVHLPTNEQAAKIKEWLLWAVIQAERELKGGTGALKLRYAYDLFVKAFPTIAPLVPFDIFKIWVDEALEQMKHLISTNKNINDYIEGGK